MKTTSETFSSLSAVAIFLIFGVRNWYNALYFCVFGHRVPPSALFHIYSNKDKIRSKNIIIYQLYVLIYACFLEAFAPKYIFGFVLVLGFVQKWCWLSFVNIFYDKSLKIVFPVNFGN